MTSKASALRLVLDDEQRMLAKTALQFVEDFHINGGFTGNGLG